MTRNRIFALLFSIIVSLVFFNQIFLGKIPFPGDALIGHYEPYKSYSYDGYAPGAVPNKAQGPDVLKEFIPWKKFVVDTYKSGQIPFWNPYNFSGNPMMANFQSGVFYPVNILFLFFPFYIAWTILIISIPILTMFFTYLFLERIKISFYASLFGGVVFAFSLYMVVWMEYGNIGHTFLWFPLALFFADRLLERDSRANFIGLVVALFLATIAGYIQGLFYIYAVVVFYFFAKGYFEKRLDKKNVFVFMLSLIFPIILSLFQLLPTLELFNASSRGNYSLDQISKMLNPIYYLISIVIPDFFGNPATRNYWYTTGTYIEQVSYFGLIPLILALFAAILNFKRAEVKIFAFVFAVTLLLTTDIFVNRYFYLIPIPVISTTVATRMLSLAAFAGAILSAIGLDLLVEEKNKNRIHWILFGFAFLFLSTIGFLFIYPRIFDKNMLVSLNISLRNSIIPICIFFLFSVLTFLYHSKLKLGHKKNSFFVIIVIFLTIFDLLYYFQKITPFAGSEFAYPTTPITSFLKSKQGIDRSWGYGPGYIESDFQTYDGVFSTEGNDPLHIKSYTQMLLASGNGQVPTVLPRPDANIQAGFGKEDLKANGYRQKILNILGVKFVYNRDDTLNNNFQPDTDTFPADKYKLIWQDGAWQAYQNLDASSRFFVTNHYIVAKNNDQVLQDIFKKSFNEKNTIVLLKNPNIPPGNIYTSAKLTEYSPNLISINAYSSKKALLFLSDNFYPGWVAKVNGVPSEIFQADYSLRAVVIPAGKSNVLFEYKPKSFYYGLYLSLFGLMLFLSVNFFFFGKNEK
ncbi:MAG TPA: YfhO family protein [Patescibacteria group bacterium]|nr:YfhO family protein [Patescibacteria group bacterium]